MQVIRHEAIHQNVHKDFRLSFCQDFFERGIVSVIIKNPIPGISTVQYVKDHSPGAWRALLGMPTDICPESIPFQRLFGPIPGSSTLRLNGTPADSNESANVIE